MTIVVYVSNTPFQALNAHINYAFLVMKTLEINAQYAEKNKFFVKKLLILITIKDNHLIQLIMNGGNKMTAMTILFMKKFILMKLKKEKEMLIQDLVNTTILITNYLFFHNPIYLQLYLQVILLIIFLDEV
jgi:hypothetical protein